MKYQHAFAQLALFVAAAFFASSLVPRAGAQSTASPPGKMSYQGFLTDDTGVPLGNTTPVNRDIIFRFFTAPTGGTLKWAEQQTVTLDKGFFTIQLGEGSGVGSEPFTNNLAALFLGSDASDRYLEITVKGTGGGSDQTVTPRVQLLTSPYAFLAQSAMAIANASGQHLLTTSGTSVGINLSGTPTATLDINGTVKATSFTGSGAGLTGITASSLADGSITAAKIATGAVGSAQIIDQSIQSVDIAPNAVGTSEIRDNDVTSTDIRDGTIAAVDLASTIAALTKVGTNHGINESAPQRPLHVSSSLLVNTGTGVDYYSVLRLEAAPRADYWDIGVDDDSHEASDDGDMVFRYRNIERGWLDATGGGFREGSDRRLKKDIEQFPKSALDKAMRIPVVRFRMVDQSSDSPKQLGVIAQDVEAVFPELVEAEGEETLTLSYSRLSVVGLAAIQELKTEKDDEINQLKTENAALKQQMLELMERLAALEKKGQ